MSSYALLNKAVLRGPLEPSQYTSIRYTDRLIAAGIAPSVGSVGDSYDNALAESQIGLYKTELIKPRRPWRTPEEVGIQTLEWIDWFNNRRLHSEIGYVPPAELEAATTLRSSPWESTDGCLYGTQGGPREEVGIVLAELGVVEQRHDAVKEVLDGGGTVSEVAERYGVTRQSLHNWPGGTGSAGWPAWSTGPSARAAARTARRPAQN